MADKQQTSLPSEECVWSKNEPKVWPRLAYEDMVDYLILSKTYDEKQMEGYRSLYAHNYVENGWLGDIFHCLEGDINYLRGKWLIFPVLDIDLVPGLEMESECVLCTEKLDNGKPTVQLREKGSNGINKASQLRSSDIITHPGQIVHIDCRKDYCNPNIINRKTNNREPVNENTIHKLRSKTDLFAFKEACLFCGQAAKLDKGKRGIDVYAVRTLAFQETVQNVCKERRDEWSAEVTRRLNTVTDLPAADAIYHQSCNVNFRTLKSVPAIHGGTSNKRFRGRPADSELEESFKLVIKYLEENEDEQIYVIDLVNKMKDICGEAAYSGIYMKQKLKEHFGESIIITEVNGKANVVTLRKTAASILHDFYQRQGIANSETRKADIINTAAKLIQADIKLMVTNKKEYPSPHQISSVQQNLDYIPESLQVFLKSIFVQKNSDIKIASIGQAIVQSSRPRVILAPLQLGLGVQLHHQFASRFLIEILNNLGFCVSYSEVQKFEASAAVQTGTDIPQFTEGHFMQYVADNVDQNVRTLDGHGTFHGMGIIACVTPGTVNNLPVKRLCVPKEELIAAGNINISYYTGKGNISVEFEDLEELRAVDPTLKLDFLVDITWSVRPQRPGWLGIMQTIHNENNSGKSSVAFMPMIDMIPSDMSCVYTTLKFVSDHAYRHGIDPILTFDQPLYWKALTIIANEPKSSPFQKIILRLGGFHTLMSFLGSIGHIMQGSGLNETLETVYAPNAVVHMMTGKAIARAIRGHLLVDRALSCILLKEILGVAMLDENENLLQEYPDKNCCDCVTYTENTILWTPVDDELVPRDKLQKLADILDGIISGNLTVEQVNGLRILDDLMERISDGKKDLHIYRTAKLWLQYMDMVEIMKTFIKAERTGNWDLHLTALSKMLPYFAASGHNLYLKSAHVYLQSMLKLKETNKMVYESFKAGKHVVRRSDRNWAGLSTDLIIEQVLMRSVKTSGGLTRGKGMTETQRTQWLLSLPTCAEVNKAVQDFSGTLYQTSDQHKETGKTRQERDVSDSKQILDFLQERNPFVKDNTLRNIETGVAAERTVNVDCAKDVGQKVLSKMHGNNANNHSFKKSQQAIVMSVKSAVKLGEESVHVDPQLLFQRLTTIVSRSEESDISDMFKYELSSVPSAIFEANGLPRTAQKSTLADAIWCLGDCGPANVLEDLDVQYVLDGGSLLHRIPWQPGTTYGQICNIYSDYVTRKYKEATIVFDGYTSGSSTKDVAHIRRTHGVVGPNVSFKECTPFKGKKEIFLTNSDDKQNFINMLSEALTKHNCHVLHAADDADVLIAKTTIDCARTRNAMLIGEDTDLLVLLCYHVSMCDFKVFFKSEGRQNIRVWDIQKTKVAIGLNVCSLLPFVHAITGCDTTSRLFGISKGAALKKFLIDEDLQSYAKVFTQKCSHSEIKIAGENALVKLYGGHEIEGLDLLRFRKFTKKITSSTSCVQVQTLPPTAAAANYHNRRVYYQVQQWISNTFEMLPEEWGWSTIDDKLVPIKTDMPPAPEKLLKIIKCSCKSNCDTRRCSCRKHGLECTIGCSECRGTNCTNKGILTEDDVSEDI